MEALKDRPVSSGRISWGSSEFPLKTGSLRRCSGVSSSSGMGEAYLNNAGKPICLRETVSAST